MCTPATLEFYQNTTGKFARWLIDRRVKKVDQVTLMLIQEYLNHVRDRGVKDSTVHAHARGARVWLLWAHQNGYHPEKLKVPMPKVAKRKQPVLSTGEVELLLRGCKSLRDKALILLMVDSGLRRAETVNVNWGDVDLETGLVEVKGGKGRKDRTVVIGQRTREVLTRYRSQVNHSSNEPLIQSVYGSRLTSTGLRQILRRLSSCTGVKVTPHILRRTFATLSLRAGVNPVHLQELMGHATLEQTRKYVVLVEDDLKRAHELYGPVDRWLIVE